MMRIIIMGTGPFAVPTAEQLRTEGHQIPLVVTRPLVDPNAKKLPPRPVYDWAVKHELEVYEPQSINSAEAIERVRAVEADLLFVCDYGQILSKECLATTPLGGINLHGSLLPRHRGAAPVQWSLLRGDSVAGVTVIHMTPRLDAGPALAVRQLDIDPDENAGELEPRLAEIGVAASMEAVAMLQDWDRETPLGIVQDQSCVTRAPRFAKQDGQLDFRLPADYLVRLIKACQPWPGTYAELSFGAGGANKRLLIRSARSFEGWPSPLESLPIGGCLALSSEVLGGSEWSAPWRKVLAVKTAEGTLLVGRLQPAGKREMDAEEFLRGHALDEAGLFLLPDEPRSRLD